MKALPSELVTLARDRRLTIVFFPRNGQPHSLPPIGLSKKYDADYKVEFETTAYELRVRETANPIAATNAGA